MGLVRRAKAGHSVHPALHAGEFFLPQEEVDAFVASNAGHTNPDSVSSDNLRYLQCNYKF